jgi:hypothetical protein
MRELAGLILVLLVACVVEEAPDDEAETAEVEQEGKSLNGTSLNGTSLNGTSLNGTSLNGTSLNGTSLNGTSLSGAKLSAVSTSGPPLAGSTVVGSTWTGTTASGATITLRIDSAQQGSGSSSDLWFYKVSYQTQTGWQPLCGTDLAVPVAGVWSTTTATYAASSTQFTFACRNRTIAKCVELGYKTWKGYSNQLASCVRMLRGDYCGNGVAYTQDGTQLNLYDNVGVQADTQSLWLLEAEWGPNGARCVTDLVINTRFLLRKLAIPTCVTSLLSLTCGKFRTGTYLIDELPLLAL